MSMFNAPRISPYDHLAVLNLRDRVNRFILNKDLLIIGRDPNCDILLTHSSISRQHIKLERSDEGQYWVTDLGSTTGTWMGDERLEPDVPKVWGEHVLLRVGDLLMQIEQVDPELQVAHDTMIYSPAESGTASGQNDSEDHPTATLDAPASGQLKALLIPTAITVEPGGVANLVVDLINDSPHSEHFLIELEGISDDWLTLPLHSIHLEPQTSQLVSLPVHPPRMSDSQTGRHPFTLLLRGLNRSHLSTQVQGQIELTGYFDFAAELRPDRFENKQITTLTIHNRGNITDSYYITAQGSQHQLRFIVPAEPQTIMPGQSRELSISVSAISPPNFGATQFMPFEVQVRSAEIGSSKILQGLLIVKAKYSAIAIGIIALVMLFCLLSIAIPSAFFGGLFGQNATPVTTGDQSSSPLDLSLNPEPTSTDIDNDGLTNSAEATLETNPLNEDSDNDGLLDGDEVARGTDPLLADSDGDGLLDGDEVLNGTDPLLADTDGDGLIDSLDPLPNTGINLSEPDSVVRSYYTSINQRDYDLTWTFLTDNYRTIMHLNRDNYAAWWDRVEHVDLGEVTVLSRSDDTATVFADLTYQMVDGSIVVDELPVIILHFNAETGNWLFFEKVAAMQAAPGS